MHKHESMSRCKFCVTDTESQALQPWVVHAENLMSETRAVFPELPAPFNHMYVKFRDLNSDSNCSPHSGDFGPIEDRREHPAVEVGIKLTF